MTLFTNYKNENNPKIGKKGNNAISIEIQLFQKGAKGLQIGCKLI